MTRTVVLVAAIVVAGCAARRDLVLIPSSPPTGPTAVENPPAALNANELRTHEADTAQLIAAARAQLPGVRERFKQGLPAGSTLYLTLDLPLTGAAPLPVFVAVLEWSATAVVGRPASWEGDVPILRQVGRLMFNEAAVLDWTIRGPGAAEDGNRLGRFLERSAPR